jgi:hypothetical protein
MNFHNVKKVTMTAHDNGDDLAWTKLKVKHGVHLQVDKSAMEGIAERLLIDKKVVREVIRELNWQRESTIEDEIIFFHDDDGFKFQIGEDD